MSEIEYIKDISELVIGEKYVIQGLGIQDSKRGGAPYPHILKEINEYYYKPWDTEKRNVSQTNLRFEDTTSGVGLDIRAYEVFSKGFQKYVIHKFLAPEQAENKNAVPTKPKRLPDGLIIRLSNDDLKNALTYIGFDVGGYCIHSIEYCIHNVSEPLSNTVIKLKKSIDLVEESAK